MAKAQAGHLAKSYILNHILLGNQNVGAEINFFLNQAVSTLYNVSKFIILTSKK